MQPPGHVAAGLDAADHRVEPRLSRDLDQPAEQGLADALPGVVLVHELIESAIASGRTRFDFLKGDETYKVRLGAAARQLFTLEGTL